MKGCLMTSLSDAVYKQTEWEHIAKATNLSDGGADETLQPLTVKHDGVWSEDSGYDRLDWHPYIELDEPITHSPAHHPYLPFPFSARDLAAFMLDGLGYFVRFRFGEWVDGPCEEILNDMPAKALTAKHAIRCAFQAYRESLAEVGGLDPTFEQRVTELRAVEDSAREEARAQFGFKKMAESTAYKEAVEATRQARRDADAAEAAWRKKMVRHLLKLKGNGNSPAVTAKGLPRTSEQSGDPAQVDDAAPVGTSNGSVKVWTDERKNEVKAYRAIHGLKKTAEYYKVSQATISKHVPAGKAKPKKATPFGGLGGK